MDAVFSDIARFPRRLDKSEFYITAYPAMYTARQLDNRFKELFRKGLVKGTVIIAAGNEASSVGMAMPFTPGKDIATLLHRNLGSHLILGCDPLSAICQYMANAQSPTHGKEGNVHFGDTDALRFPMVSHLGSMLPISVGSTWSARRNGSGAFGLAVIGDGGSSTGQFHEALNMASVNKVPVVFIIENNGYAFSTPVEYQYNCKSLADRAAGYGIKGRTVNGLDAYEVYSAVTDSLELMSSSPQPVLIESMTVRLEGHAVYDNAEYISDEVKAANWKKDPLVHARAAYLENCNADEHELAELENSLCSQLDSLVNEALKAARPDASSVSMDVFAPVKSKSVKPYSAKSVRNTNAINTALGHILEENSNAFVCGQDVSKYGSAFKTCKGLVDRFGSERIIDTPICEAGTVGFCLGASQTGSLPVMEFQFADFSTEAVTQLGVNTGTWFFRSGKPAQLLFRLPSGGGITLGAFHSGEFDGLWSRFPGLKLFYPVTPQETYEALIAGFYDPNPCIVFEHKLLYWGKAGDIEFDGSLQKVYRPRQYTQGADITIVAVGAMVEQALNAVSAKNYSASVWNPFILNPLSFEPILDSVRSTGRLLVVQEAGEIAGMGSHFISLAVQKCFSQLKCAPVLVSAPDTPVPFAKELESAYLPDAGRIEAAIAKMIGDVK
ncbi:MAG: thiamine pyrophosphate-dependent enzyme [Chitinispirillia bacterium]|nr:thiamine pyrophosphate-dependent enzyme [Chitinispirillia bacterium]